MIGKLLSWETCLKDEICQVLISLPTIFHTGCKYLRVWGGWNWIIISGQPPVPFFSAINSDLKLNSFPISGSLRTNVVVLEFLQKKTKVWAHC